MCWVECSPVLRRILIVGCLATLLAVSPADLAAKPQAPFAFGGTGGFRGPYSVTIGGDGSVSSTGDLMRIGVQHLTQAKVAALSRIAIAVGFAQLPRLTRCPGAPSYAEVTFVRFKAAKIAVHGGCITPYQRLLKALRTAVHFGRSF